MKFKPFLAVLLVLLLISLTSFLYLSSFTRLHGDDFCISADATQLNPESFFVNWYSGWTGRFSYIIFAGVLSLGGPKLASVLPTISVLVWWTVLIWVISPLTTYFKIEKKILISALSASFILLVLFSAIPNLFQSVFWKDGLINYSFPLIGFTLISGVLLRISLGRIQGLFPIVLLLILSFITGGFSEVFTVVQVVIYVILLGFLVIFSPKNKRTYFMLNVISALIGALIAFFVVLSAPGNQTRQILLPEHPDLMRLFTFSIRNAVYIIAKFLIKTPGWGILTVMVPFISGWYLASRKKIKKSNHEKSPIWKKEFFQGLVILPAVTFLISLAACIPVVYMIDAYPEDRTIILPLFFIIIGIFSSSVFLGIGFSKFDFSDAILKRINIKPILMVSIFFVLTFASVDTVIINFNKLPGFQLYARRWDKRDQRLRSMAKSGNSIVTAFGLESRFGIADLREDPSFWVNQCMADYYDIPELIGK